MIEDTDKVLGRKYNVEYLDGRGRCQTFNNTLANIDGTYFWFSSEQDGLALVKQDRVTFMYCTDRPNRENDTNFNSHISKERMARERATKIDDYYNWCKKNFLLINAVIKTCRYFDLYYSRSLYETIFNNKDLTNHALMRMYLYDIDHLSQYKGKTFKDSEF